MDAALRQALQPVIRDLQRDGLVLPVIEDREWASIPDQPSTMLRSADGSSTGISVSRSIAAAERIVAVADQVQEWAIEEQWARRAATNWPRCPQHPDAHPMAARTVDQTAVWICPASEQVISAIGELQ